MSVFEGFAGRTLRAWVMVLGWLAVLAIVVCVWGVWGALVMWLATDMLARELEGR